MALPSSTPDTLTPHGSSEALSPVASDRKRIRLWDLPLRLFHWALVLAVSVAIATGLAGGAWMPVHGQAGLAIVGLLSFRIVWGVLGSTYARFATFVPSPRALLDYLRGRWQGAGHNPLGALSVLVLLVVLGAQLATGLVGNDEIAFTGPLASWVDEELSLRWTGWHHQLVNLLYALIGLHVAAIAFHGIVKKDKLVPPMVTGWKDVPATVPTPRRAGVGALLLALAVAGGAVYAASGVWLQEAAPEANASPMLEAPGPTASAPQAPAW